VLQTNTYAPVDSVSVDDVFVRQVKGYTGEGLDVTKTPHVLPFDTPYQDRAGVECWRLNNKVAEFGVSHPHIPYYIHTQAICVTRTRLESTHLTFYVTSLTIHGVLEQVGQVLSA
jgi:hypothetical protein